VEARLASPVGRLSPALRRRRDLERGAAAEAARACQRLHADVSAVHGEDALAGEAVAAHAMTVGVELAEGVEDDEGHVSDNSCLRLLMSLVHRDGHRARSGIERRRIKSNAIGTRAAWQTSATDSAILGGEDFMIGPLAAAARFAARLPRHARLFFRYRDSTMILPRHFIVNLELCRRLAPKRGCIVECGVWRGGMSAAMADTLPGRVHFLFDSFEGLPPAKEIDGEEAIAYQRDKTSSMYHDNCRAERSYAERAMGMSAAADYHLIQGWFADTLPGFIPPEPIAVLRLDGDWYDSTMQSLENLYPHVAPGGLVLVDDYYAWDGCARAVHDFLSSTKSVARIKNIGGVCYFRQK
jgi:O-methyltransferase